MPKSTSMYRSLPLVILLLLATAAFVAPADADPVDSADAPHTHQSHEGHEDPHEHGEPADYDELVITGAPFARRQFDVIRGSSVLFGEALERAMQSSLGETLSAQPGISSTYYGAVASRPVVRGLEGPRIRVLQNGVGALDASVTSPDHAVTVDPLSSDRIEIIRGAGTLMYGSGAIGGVVNIEDGRIPMEVPVAFANGDVRLLYGSAADEMSAGAGITAGQGPIAVNASGFFRNTEDVSIPGFAVSDALAALAPALDRGPYGTAENTASQSKGGSLGASLVGEQDVVGAAFGVADSVYGVPTDPDEAITIDLDQLRIDARLETERDWLVFDESSFRFGYADYEHTEFEGDVAGTVFENESYEGRIDLVQSPWWLMDGGTGFHFLHREFSATGDEAFVPRNTTNNFGLFAVEQIDLDPVNVEFGLRYEHQKVEADSIDFERKFDVVSFSIGASWEIFDDYLIGGSIARNERAPAAEELLSNGPHLATSGYDVGDPSLGKEAGTTLEATARKRHGRWSAGVNVYYTHFKDFIYLQNAGPVDENGNSDPTGGLMLRKFLQDDAVFVGGEVQGAVEVVQTEPFTGVVDLAFDWVKGTVQNDRSDRLPRIPPMRVKGGIEGRSQYADLRFELWWVAEQDRTAAYELPTDDYLMLNLYLTLHPFPELNNVTLILQGRNLTDAEARVHASFLKDRLPLPGREARVGMKVSF